MAGREPFKELVSKRIKALRKARELSQTGLWKATGELLSKSRISNYEQGTRLPGPDEAVILAKALRTSAAHVLCLDDDAPILGPEEEKLMRAYRLLPASQQDEYFDRITTLGMAFAKPIPGDKPTIKRYASVKNRKAKKGAKQ